MYPGECFANTFFLVGGVAVFVATTSSNPPGWVVLVTLGGTLFQTISTATACNGGPSATICIRKLWGLPLWEHANYDPWSGQCVGGGGGGGGGGSW